MGEHAGESLTNATTPPAGALDNHLTEAGWAGGKSGENEAEAKSLSQKGSETPQSQTLIMSGHLW